MKDIKTLATRIIAKNGLVQAFLINKEG